MTRDEKNAKIRRLFFGEHWKVGTIAKQLGVHHSTVKRVINADQMAHNATTAPSKLDPYVDFMRDILKQYPDLTGTRVHEMLVERGYDGGVSQVRRRILKENLRPAPRGEVFLKLDTLPGEQGQVDWGDFGVLQIGNTERRLSGFVIVLSWSRAISAHFSLDQKMASVIGGHIKAFDDFGGVPRTLLYDNMKTVVLERDGDAIRFHPTFLNLASHYLFAPHPCRPRRANEKGRVERAIRYLRQSFFAGRHFADLQDVRTQFEDWRENIAHKRPWPQGRTRTVADVFEEEKPSLLSLPLHPFEATTTRAVQAKKQPYIRFDTNLYSIPWRATGKPLTLVADEGSIRIFDGDMCIAEHTRSWDRQRTIDDPRHFEGLLDHKRLGAPLKGRAQFLDAIPEAYPLYQSLTLRSEPLGPQTSKLLVLLQMYGADVVRTAVLKAIERQTMNADSVAYLIEKSSTNETPKLRPKFKRADVASLDIKQHKLEDYDD